jgi:hypothetical protein
MSQAPARTDRSADAHEHRHAASGSAAADSPVVAAPTPDASGDDPDHRQDPFDPRIEHRVQIRDRGPFVVAACEGCGWESYARRSRGLARREGHDHELLHPS